ncbi:EI24 domain-containing protein [Marivita sp. GX14005]|uniref:EI24 domain-containing protein n=1 Tax=Marivita sp. GX14005 TaxID=2942276 RepID=UPI002019AC1F|nr:EI24 domain-containing protein [Marivita sp. GX14005]MCL3881715.1 EI24 domain-containing protein [Marivita sp. GX14005]
MGLGVIFQSLFLALNQIGDPRFRKVLFLGIALSVLLLAGFSAGFVWLVNALLGPEMTLPFIGPVTWIDDVAGWAVLLLMIVLSVFLMVPVASAMSSLFLDTVADAVEERNYPELPAPNHVPIAEALRDTIGFLGVLIGANIVALIFYLLAPPLAPLIFWALNGFLLGSEYFTLAAIRREGRRGAKALRKRHLAKIWGAGFLMALPLSVPVLNLAVPIIGAATFTHLYHRIQGRAPSDRRSRYP